MEEEILKSHITTFMRYHPQSLHNEEHKEHEDKRKLRLKNELHENISFLHPPQVKVSIYWIP